MFSEEAVKIISILENYLKSKGLESAGFKKVNFFEKPPSHR